jgi:pimeloyl-ACP methyl ester carboxylesterase
MARQRAERYYNIVQFTGYQDGGHFAIHERADEMADDLRRFFRPFRQQRRR